eukprot:349984-Chlamydomonas_euryale.AAC.1
MELNAGALQEAELTERRPLLQEMRAVREGSGVRCRKPASLSAVHSCGAHGRAHAAWSIAAGTHGHRVQLPLFRSPLPPACSLSL